MSSPSLSLCATRVMHLHRSLARLHSCSGWGASHQRFTIFSSSASSFTGVQLHGTSSGRQSCRNRGALGGAGRLHVWCRAESALAPEQSASALRSGQFVDGVLGVKQSAGVDDKSGSSSDLIFLGTGTSEGVPRVSCQTNTSKRCPVTLLHRLSRFFLSPFCFLFQLVQSNKSLLLSSICVSFVLP